MSSITTDKTHERLFNIWSLIINTDMKRAQENIEQILDAMAQFGMTHMENLTKHLPLETFCHFKLSF